MIIMKFGGTSLKDSERIKNVAEIIKLNQKKNPIVVCSAIGGITDMLVEIAKHGFKGENTKDLQKALREKHETIIRELGIRKDVIDNLFIDLERLMERVEAVKLATAETNDHISSFGERMSCRIVSEYVDSTGIASEAHDAFDVGMVTTPEFGKAEPLPHVYDLIKEKLSGLKHIPIITGFIGKTTAGEITTLSRGGSDYTAAIIGAAVGAGEIQIWTDVDGVMTTDPRITKKARTIPNLSFDEASELAIFGAKVIHPKTIVPAVEKNIPVRVLNTYNPNGMSTLIVNDGKPTGHAIKAIACKKGIGVVNLVSTRMLNTYGYLARLFEVFKDYKKSIDMISTSEVGVSMTLDDHTDMEKIMEELSQFAMVKLEENKAIICVVGSGMKNAVGTAGRVFKAVGEASVDIHMISQGASEINIGFVVNESDADHAVSVLHKEFIETD